jgi:NAD(P)H dehydrogenase (quinone)
MSAKPKILVLEATGQVGQLVVQHLQNSPNIEVIAAARNPQKAKDLGVAVVQLDLDKVETIEPALKGIDRAFLATGYTIDMMRQSKDFLNAAKRQGVKYIVHLGACGDNDTRVAHYGWHQSSSVTSSGVNSRSPIFGLRSSCKTCWDTMEKAMCKRG